MKELGGKVAVVTGGASGIGLAMAQRFGQEEMKVVIADIVAERIDEAVTSLRDQGLEVHGVRTDVTKLESVEHLAEETLATYGGVHVVCNNAGLGPGGQLALWEYEPADWRWCLRGTSLGASVLFPGPGMLRTKLYEAWATRPNEYQRETERTQGHFTYDDVLKIMRASNATINETPLEEVADRVYRAILDDTFWILPPNEQSDGTMRKRYESMRDRRNPDYFREWKPEAADS